MKCFYISSDNVSLPIVYRTHGLTFLVPLNRSEQLFSILTNSISNCQTLLNREIIDSNLKSTQIASANLEIFENYCSKVRTFNSYRSQDRFFLFIQIIKRYFLPLIKGLNFLSKKNTKDNTNELQIQENPNNNLKLIDSIDITL